MRYFQSFTAVGERSGPGRLVPSAPTESEKSRSHSSRAQPAGAHVPQVW